MPRLRYSIGGLMALVVFAAVVFAALRFPTPMWASALLTIALAACAVSTLGALFRRGRARAFWAGFTIAGAGYLALAVGPWLDVAIGQRLITTQLLDQLYARLHRQGQQEVSLIVDASTPVTIDAGSNFTVLKPAAFSSSGRVLASTDTWGSYWNVANGQVIDLPGADFRVVGHALVFWIIALAGGLVACRFVALNARDDDRARQAAAPEASSLACAGGSACDFPGSPSAG